MHRSLIYLAVAAVTGSAWGCAAGTGADDPFAAWPRHDAALADAARALGRDAGPLPTTHRSASAVDLAADGGLDQLLHLALGRNPDIRAARQKVARLAERVPQVTSLEDPVLQVAPFGEMAETAAGQVGVMSGLSQRIPTPGKLQARGRIAAQEVA
ncbi:MAG: hypothetical protein OER86_09045, partial [Phycisphaerae bacterium]|nr:hypothetical protein [Phycisphaerae bacterium]